MNKGDIFGFRNLIKKDGWRVGTRSNPLSIHLFLLNYWNPEMSANIDRKCTIIKYWKAKCTKKEMDGIFDERFLI